MLKKALAIVFVFLGLFASALSAASLLFFDLDSPIYNEMNALYVMEGMAVPPIPKPWTEIDVERLLGRVNPTSETSKTLYDAIKSHILVPKGDFSGYFDIYVSPQFLLHSNPDEFNSYSSIAVPGSLNEAFAGFSLYASFKENFAGYLDFDVAKLSSTMEQSLVFPIGYVSGASGIPSGSTPSEANFFPYDSRYGKWVFGSNIIGIPSFAYSPNFPNRTYLVGGTRNFRASVGRDRLKFGAGLMGDMLIGDTLPWHNYFEVAFTGSEWFGYTFLMDFFTYETNFNNPFWFDFNIEGIRYLINHRFDFSMFRGKLNLSVNDSQMFASPDFVLDPLSLIPLFFLHNVYLGRQANSLISVEVEYAPIKNFSAYIEAAMDDVPGPDERGWNEKVPGAALSGWGIMGGVRGTIPYGKDYFTLNGEIVYTSPYLYHRANYTDQSQTGYEQNLYFVSSLRTLEGQMYKGIFQYLSFPFGSDAIAGLLRFGYERPSLWRVNFDAFFMAHGIIRKFSLTKFYPEGSAEGFGDELLSPSTVNPSDTSENGPVEYTLVLGGTAIWDVYSWLKLEGSLYYIGVLNKNNRKTNWLSDVQLGVNVTISY